MLTPSLSAADIFSVLDELGRSTRVPLWLSWLSVRVGRVMLLPLPVLFPAQTGLPKAPRCSLDQVVLAAP